MQSLRHSNLLNTEGAEALTLNRLAQKLGVKTPSLYNHVDGLPGLYRELALLNARMLVNASHKRRSANPAGGVDRNRHSLSRVHQRIAGVYLASLRSSGAQQPVDAELSAAEEKSLHVTVAVVASFGLTGEDALHAVRGLRASCMFRHAGDCRSFGCRSAWMRALIGCCRCSCAPCSHGRAA